MPPLCPEAPPWMGVSPSSTGRSSWPPVVSPPVPPLSPPEVSAELAWLSSFTASTLPSSSNWRVYPSLSVKVYRSLSMSTESTTPSMTRSRNWP